MEQRAASVIALNTRDQLRAYFDLTKPRVVALIVFTAVVGMLLAAPGYVPVEALIFGTLGIAMASASAAAFNHVLDRQADAEMARTRGRPLPTGQLSVARSLGFAAALGVAAIGLLVWQVNMLTAVLTLLSLIGYAVIYTLYLKRATPQNIVIGGAAGAAPPVLGWSAVTGELHLYPWLLFLIIFVWTPPHFWALAYHRVEEYAKVDIPMLPVTHGLAYTRLQILLYSVLLLAVSTLPFALGMSGAFYLAGALVLGAGFLYYAVLLYRNHSPDTALALFRFSITYLFGIFALLLADHYLDLLL